MASLPHSQHLGQRTYLRISQAEATRQMEAHRGRKAFTLTLRLYLLKVRRRDRVLGFLAALYVVARAVR